MAALSSRIPADRVITDPDVLVSYADDEAEWAAYSVPLAMVRPRTAEDVQAVVRVCLEHGAPSCPGARARGSEAGPTRWPAASLCRWRRWTPPP